MVPVHHRHLDAGVHNLRRIPLHPDGGLSILWTKVSGTLNFNRTLRQGTQDTSMTMQYSRNSENVGTALSECTTGKQLETGPTTDLEKHEAEEHQE